MSHVRVRRHRQMVVAASLAAVYELFCIEENREEEAEKTPSTCSTVQGSQHFSHLDYCGKVK